MSQQQFNSEMHEKAVMGQRRMTTGGKQEVPQIFVRNKRSTGSYPAHFHKVVEYLDDSYPALMALHDFVDVYEAKIQEVQFLYQSILNYSVQQHESLLREPSKAAMRTELEALATQVQLLQDKINTLL